MEAAHRRRGGNETVLTLDQLPATDEQVAVIDCTGGWYAERRWQGVRLARLLDTAGVKDGSRSVVVRSVTGYSRRLPWQKLVRRCWRCGTTVSR